MKTVVITGSARGFGYAMLQFFRKNNCNVVITDISDDTLSEAKNKLEALEGHGEVLAIKADVTNENDIQNLIDKTLEKFNVIDIWINNAGVNQPNKPIWELEFKSIDQLIDIDLKGTIICSKLVMPVMLKQGSGQIFNVEGYGSNDAKMMGLSIYGTAKRAVTYFTEALANECKETRVLVGKITPGIMITNFIHNAVGNEAIELDEKTKKVYNILGDYPETIAEFMVEKILKNDKNDVKFTWLTNRKASWRFMTSMFNKRDFFKGENK